MASGGCATVRRPGAREKPSAVLADVFRMAAWGYSSVRGPQMPPSEPQSAGAKAEERQEGKPCGYRRRQSQRRQAAKAWLVHLEFTRYADVR